jgi:hypothetical protein
VQQLSKAVDADGKELPPLSANAVVQRDGNNWRLELVTEMDGRRGTRLLEADSCEGLARAATLVMALTLGEGLARRQAEDEARAQKPPPPPPPPPSRPPAPKKPSEPAPPAPVHARLWAATGLGTDALGSFGPTFALGGAYQPNLFELGVELRVTLPRSTELRSANADARSFTYGGGVQACFLPRLSPLRLFACADAGITVLDVEGRGTALDQRARVPLYGLGPSLGADWLLGRHAFLGLGLVSRFFVTRPELVVEGLAQRRRVETASVSAELAGGVRW